MSKAPLVLTLVTAGSWFSGNPVLAVLVTAVSGGAYLWSLTRNPWRPCGRCGGSKSHRDKLWAYASGGCRKCGGDGRFVRLGVKVLTPGRAEQLRNGQLGRYG